MEHTEQGISKHPEHVGRSLIASFKTNIFRLHICVYENKELEFEIRNSAMAAELEESRKNIQWAFFRLWCIRLSNKVKTTNNSLMEIYLPLIPINFPEVSPFQSIYYLE